jgi:hypothetical protein
MRLHLYVQLITAMKPFRELPLSVRVFLEAAQREQFVLDIAQYQSLLPNLGV